MRKLVTIVILLISSTVYAQSFDQVDSLIKSYYSENSPGICLTIIKDERIIYEKSIGLANIEDGVPINDSTSFHIASVSKQFAAYLALKLEEEGKLNLNDPIKKYLPELKGLPYPITLKQLANHTHGLPNISELVNLKGFGISDRLCHKDVVNVALSIQTANFEAGEKYQYGNTGYVLLAEIIERVADMPFQEALKHYIFEPLKMNATMAVSSPDQIIQNKAESYRGSQEGYQLFDMNNMANGSSGIRTTGQDLAKWAAHFQKTVKEEFSTFNKMTRNSTLNNGTVLSYGLGLEMKKYKGLKAVFHGGGDAAYRAYTLHFPEQNFSVMILGNTNDYWPLEIAYRTADLLISNYFTPELKAPIKMPRSGNSLTGTYSNYPGNYLKFEEKNDTLFFSVVGNSWKLPLEPIGQNEFVYPFYPKSRFVFHKQKLVHHIADFKYEYLPINPQTKIYELNELRQYEGFYRNESLNTILNIRY